MGRYALPTLLPLVRIADTPRVAISSFRVYALRQNLPLALLVLTLGLFPVVCDVVSAKLQHIAF